MALTLDTSFEREEDQRGRRSNVYANFEYAFQNFGQYAISSLCYCLTPTAYVYFDQSDPNHPPITLILAISVFVCLPVYYMEVFLGRYTQNSILHLKYMVPIAKGLPYALLSVTVLYTLGAGYYLADALLYLLMCFQKNLPWTVCPKNITETCYYHREPPNCERCMHSSMAYWKYIYMDKPALTYDVLHLGVPILHRFVSSCISWLLIFLITAAAYKQMHKSLSVLFYVYGTLMAVVFVVVLLNVGATTDLPHIFTVAPHSYLESAKWAEAMVKSVQMMKLGHAHHVLAGARLPRRAPVGLWCVYFWLMLMTVAMFSTMFTMAVGSVQKHHTGGKVEAVMNLHQLVMIIIPGGLTYTGAAHVWSAIFFFSMVTLLIANIAARLITLQLNITNFKPSLHKFKVYLLVGYCLTFALVSIVLLSENHYALSRLLLEDSTWFIELIATTLLIVVVFWIYGIQTISDDILFLMNHKPIRFWIVTWYVCPIVLIVVVAYIVVKLSEMGIRVLILISTVVILIPLLGCAVHEVFVYVKKRRLLGLIEPELEWGMPDPEERHMRRVFNPRSETKFEGKRTACNHKCIKDSAYLKAVLYHEDLTRRMVLGQEGNQTDVRMERTDFENDQDEA